MPRRVWGAAAVLVAVSVFAVWATRDNRNREPPRASIEALVGRPVSAPVYHSSSHLNRWRAVARIWWTYYTLPIPNQMAMWVPGDAWVYTFEAPPPYRVPAPFACTEARTCRASVGEWRYEVTVANGRGTLVARLP